MLQNFKLIVIKAAVESQAGVKQADALPRSLSTAATSLLENVPVWKCFGILAPGIAEAHPINRDSIDIARQVVEGKKLELASANASTIEDKQAQMLFFNNLIAQVNDQEYFRLSNFISSGQMKLQLFAKRSSTALYISSQHAETSSSHIFPAFLVQIENFSTCISTSTLLKSSISPIQYTLSHCRTLRSPFFEFVFFIFMFIFVCDNRDSLYYS